MNGSVVGFFTAMARDMKRANKELEAVNKLQDAVDNYERIMGVKVKIEIEQDETCS